MSTWSYTVAPSGSAAPSAGDSAPLAKQDDHAGYAVDKLLEFFKGLPRMEATLSAFVGMLQPLEDLCWQLLRERYLVAIDGEGPAEGAQLDGLGEILGEPRAGRSDTEYRLFLQVRILVNNSDGTWPDLWAIMDLLPFVVTEAEEIYPHHIWIEAVDTEYGYGSWKYLREAKPAGVGLSLILSQYGSTGVFELSTAYATEQADAGTGLAGEYVSTGGRMTGVAR